MQILGKILHLHNFDFVASSPGLLVYGGEEV